MNTFGLRAGWKASLTGVLGHADDPGHPVLVEEAAAFDLPGNDVVPAARRTPGAGRARDSVCADWGRRGSGSGD